MSKKEQILKAVIELAVTEARIDELKRAKTYQNSLTYYRNRLIVLEEKCFKLENIINGKEDAQEIKLVFHVPSSSFQTKERNPEDFMQYLKREFLVQA